MNVTQFRNLTDPRGRAEEWSWEQLQDALAKPQPGKREELPGWSPAAFRGDQRAKERVQQVFAFVGDIDKGAVSLRQLRAALTPWRAVIHSTSRSTPSAPRWRFVVALSRPVSAEEHLRIWEFMHQSLADEGIALDDGACKDPARFWFVPSHPAEGEFQSATLDGEPFDVDSLPAPMPRPSGVQRVSCGNVARARAYAAQAEPAVSGQGGHNVAMRVATAVVRGFDLRNEADALEALADWNARCEPPWSPKELLHKVREATAKGAMPWGAKLQRPADTRPTIRLGAELHVTVSEAVDAIGANVAIFQRGGQLVRVVRTENTARAPGSPSIRPVSAATLLEVLTKVAVWERFDGRSKDWVRTKPPSDVVAAVLDRGQWPGVRTLTGVVEAPSLRPDGTVLQGGAGHDAASGYMLIPNAEFPEVPSNPTHSDAVQAVTHLLDLVQDFPFATEAHRSAWLAFLLTLFARSAIRGCTPLMAVTATTRGTGKGKLVSVTSLIATGRDIAVTPCPEKDEELRKTITTLLSEGERLACFDNIADTLKFASLDAALTSAMWKDRILGRTQSIEIANDTVLAVTGNNIHFEADTARRALLIRLESPLENPEDRDDFRHRNLLEYVRKNRPALVRDALTILRAYYAAGAPKTGPKPWGSFESWTRVIANCVVWLGLPDPQETRTELAEADVGKTMLAALLAGWERLAPEGMTVKTALGVLYPAQRSVVPDGYDDLREAIEHFAPSLGGKPPNPRRLGDVLRGAKRRVIGGRRLETASAYGGTVRWRIQRQGGVEGV